MIEKMKFPKEYYLQRITNAHLKELFDLEFITAEFQFQNERIDGLAYDKKSKSFFIIEYKNKTDSGLLNQVKSYYDLFKDNRQEFINRYNKKFNLNLQEKDILKKAKVMIISPELHQDLGKSECNLELYTATLYQCDEENGCILYEKVNGNVRKMLKIKLDELKISKEELFEDKTPRNH